MADRPPRPASMKRRLLVGVLGAVAAIWLATAIVSYRDARRETDDLLDAHLAQIERVERHVCGNTLAMSTAQVVQNDDLMTCGFEPLYCVTADVSCSTRDEYSHGVPGARKP